MSPQVLTPRFKRRTFAIPVKTRMGPARILDDEADSTECVGVRDSSAGDGKVSASRRDANDTAPIVSVLMTAYNRADLIAESIESVLAQTFKDFELIVVDDCSSDRTVDVVNRYLVDSRVRLIRNERNLGDYPNRNHASTFARGEFLKYHDSDDVMYPNCLEIMVRGLRAFPSAAFALSGNRGWPGGQVPMLLTPRMSYQREFLGSGLFNQGPASAMFRSDAFHELGRFPVAGVHSDTQFWVAACARRSIVLVQANLFYYRVHGGQELQAYGPYTLAAAEGQMFRALDAAECPLEPGERQQAKRNLAWGFIERAIHDLRRGAPPPRPLPTSKKHAQSWGLASLRKAPASRNRGWLACPFGEGSGIGCTFVKVVHALGWYYPENLGGTEIYVAGLCRRMRSSRAGCVRRGSTGRSARAPTEYFPRRCFASSGTRYPLRRPAMRRRG